MKLANNSNMHLWELDEKKTRTTVLCTQCSNDKYKQLFMRKQWISKDRGRTIKCDGCGKDYVLENRSSL